MSKLPFDKIIAVDAETAWGRKIDLGFSSQTNEEYIRDPRFKAWGLCWNEVDLNASIWQKDQPVEHRAVWVRGKDIAEWGKGFDWSRTAVVAHNAQFDVTILSWLYGIKPAFIFDTLSMGRALRGVEVGNSLKKLAEDFELPPKGTELASSENYLDELPFEIEMALADYCRHDVWLCEQLFLRMLPGYPSKELRLIDLTLRMYTEPWLELDKEMLTNAIEEERHARQGLLTRLGVDEAALASNEQFAAILEGLGIEAPTKVSKTTGKRTLALAKNDAHFQALLNSDDENLVHLCEARLAVKSTMQRTRAQRFLGIAERGRLPFPITYFGAVTGRYTACLVADTKILVYDRRNGQCTKKIVDVLPDDLVWDGIEFVQHEGVQFSGYKEVMTYDGITGTPEHKVFLSEDTSCTLAEAAERSASIMDAAEPDSGAVARARERLQRLRW